jgi:hypothetical protein
VTPEELEKLPKPLERSMTALELSIMNEIIERIKETAQITPVIDWLLVRLDAIGKSRSHIKQLIGDAINDAGLKIDDIYDQAAQSDFVRNKEIYEATGRDYLPYEDNEWLQQVVDAARRQTKDSLRPMENITQTTGFNVMMGNKRVFTPMSEYLERSLDKAMLGITTGAKTYSQAIGDVIDEMTSSGVRVVDYASGKSDRIEVAARRAVMTGVAQMTDKVNEKNAEELHTDYWEVDWHMGARNTGTGYKNHQSWQGKVYSSEEMRTVCGLGEMLGFAGINCYHIRFPFIPGISKRKYTDEWLEEQNRKENEKKTFHGKEYDTYGALQYQRKLERTIRKQKQDVELLEKGGADQDDITAAKCRLRLTNKTYVDFSKEMGLRQQRERLRIGKADEKNRIFDVNRMKLPDDIMQINGMTEDRRIEIEKAITVMQKQYDIRIGGISVESLGYAEKKTLFMTGPYIENEKFKMALVINKDVDYNQIEQVLEKRYQNGFFASRTIGDAVKHELAHVMTFQDCESAEEYITLRKMIKDSFVEGISGYADRTNDGAESLAEAFVRIQNGEKVPLSSKLLVRKYITRWKK